MENGLGLEAKVYPRAARSIGLGILRACESSRQKLADYARTHGLRVKILQRARASPPARARAVRRKFSLLRAWLPTQSGTA